MRREERRPLHSEERMQRVATGECSKAEQAPKWHKAVKIGYLSTAKRVKSKTIPSVHL
jgi:hypothetical protein